MVAPKDACKGTDPSPGWYGTYLWDEQLKRNSARDREQDVRLKAASVFTPEEQKELDDNGRQARDLERQAVAVIRTTPDEAARLRAEERPFIDKANAVRKAHNERIFPALEAIRKEYSEAYIEPAVTVSVVVNTDNWELEAKEPLQIQGAVSAFITSDKKLTMSFGTVAPAKAGGGVGTKPRTIWVQVGGPRQPAETIGKLLGTSGLGSVAKSWP